MRQIRAPWQSVQGGPPRDGRRDVLLPPPRDWERAQEMVRLYHEEGLTLDEIGGRYRVTRERVRQLLAQAGRPSVIGALQDIEAMVAGSAGTRISPDVDGIAFAA